METAEIQLHMIKMRHIKNNIDRLAQKMQLHC